MELPPPSDPHASGQKVWHIESRGLTLRELHPLRGALFETMLVSDLVKQGMGGTDQAEWYYWNNNSVMEVDLLCWKDGQLSAMEIKSGATFRPEYLKNLQKWSNLSGTPASRLQLLYGGQESFIHAGIKIRSWKNTRLDW